LAEREKNRWTERKRQCSHTWEKNETVDKCSILVNDTSICLILFSAFGTLYDLEHLWCFIDCKKYMKGLYQYALEEQNKYFGKI
jgi:hypothetical protein